MWGTPVGYEFRDFINKWDEILLQEQKERNIRMFLEGSGFVMYFLYGEGDEQNVYACGENSRVTYSKMKKPDDETEETWIDEANFKAFNLSKAIKGQPSQEIFFSTDIPLIEIIDKEEAYNVLSSESKSSGIDNIISGAKSVFKILKNATEK